MRKMHRIRGEKRATRLVGIIYDRSKIFSLSERQIPIFRSIENHLCCATSLCQGDYNLIPLNRLKNPTYDHSHTLD